MKRVVSSSLISVFIIIAVAAGIIYYQQYNTVGAHAFNCVPADASFVISSRQASSSIHQLTRSAYWKDLSTAESFKNTSQQLTFFDNALSTNKDLNDALQTNPLLLSFHVTAANDFDILFLSEGITYPKADKWMKLLSNGNTSSRNYNGAELHEVNTINGLFTYTVIRGVFAGSFSAFLVEDAIRQQRSASVFTDLVTDNKNNLSLFVNHRQLPTWLSIYLETTRKQKISRLAVFANYSLFDISISENEISFNGITVADSSHYLNTIVSQQPIPFSIKKILPSKTAAVIWFGISDWNQYFKDLRSHFSINGMQSQTNVRIAEIEKNNRISIDAQWLYWLGDQYALVVTEPVSTNYDNASYAVFKTTETAKALAALGRLAEKANAASGKSQQNEERYNGRVIRYLDIPGLLPALFGGLFNRITRFYYTDIDGFIIVANQPSALRSLINDNATGNMATDDAQLNSIMNHLPDRSNFCFYSNISSCTYILRSIASSTTIDFIDQNKKTWNRCDALIYTATTQNKTLKSNAYFHYKTDDTKGVHQLWTCTLDTTVTSAPQFISDSSHTIQALVQDDNYTLYKIDNTGTIQWKKKLDTRILSSFYPVYPHHNNTVCYLFNTRSFIYMIDAVGNNCPGYPIRLPRMATNGVSLVDYYGNGDYRIFLACGNMSMYGWLLNGKPLGGWYFKKTQYMVTDSLQHFRFDKKDYLVFTDEGSNLYALNKMGQRQLSGVSLSKKTGTRFYSSQNENDTTLHLMVMDTSGGIQQLKNETLSTVLTAEQTGKPLTWLPWDVNADRQDDFVLLGEQSLKILSNDNLVLASQTYTDKMNAWIKKFTLIDGKTRLGIYSSEAGNIYLLNKDGLVINGFPVSGSTAFDVMNSPSDKRSYLISGSTNNVYLYGIN